MRSPADMQIIQVDVTDACESRCGACTRLVAHVDKPFFVTPAQFEKAIRSMEGWRGQVLGMMGGNPVLHPEFEKLARMFAELWGRPTLAANGRQPIKDFSRYAMDRLGDASSRRGLWSSLGAKYYHHYELIQEIFDYQCLNDHYNAGLHQGLLIDRFEIKQSLGITDDQWLENRDKCWVQNTWSASVNHHGAYFCEVAAALDNLLFDGKSAWPVEPGWWKRKPAEFHDQLHLCDHCALAQPGPSVVAREDRDIVGRMSLPLLDRSPAVKKGAVEIYDPKNPEHQAKGRDFRVDWYMPEPHQRVSPVNKTVKPHKVTMVVVCVGREEHLAKTIRHNAANVDELFIVTDNNARDYRPDVGLLAGLIGPKAMPVITSSWKNRDFAFNKGAMINDALAMIQHPDWILLTDADVFLDPGTLNYIKDHALNPGVLYGAKRREGSKAPDLEDGQPNGYFQLFNYRAQAIRDRWPRIMCEEFCSAGGVDSWFLQQFPEGKQVVLPLTVEHIPHAKAMGEHWNGPRRTGWRQMGLLTLGGLQVTESPLAEPKRLKITDTLHGRSEVIEGCAIPKDVAKIVGDDIVFMGERLGYHHLHLAYWAES